MSLFSYKIGDHVQILERCKGYVGYNDNVYAEYQEDKPRDDVMNGYKLPAGAVYEVINIFKGPHKDLALVKVVDECMYKHVQFLIDAHMLA